MIFATSLSPLRLTLFEERLYPLPRIGSLHQFLGIDFFCAGQALVEVSSVPGIRSLFSDTKSCWAELEQESRTLLDGCRQPVFGDRARGQANLSRRSAEDRAPGENQL